jgi:preprotein translocase subunit Sss1
MEPKALVKSIYNMYMSCDVSRASSRAAINVWICREVLRSCRKPSWLVWSIWYFSP